MLCEIKKLHLQSTSCLDKLCLQFSEDKCMTEGHCMTEGEVNEGHKA